MLDIGLISIEFKWNTNGEGFFPIMIDAEKLR